MKKVLLMAVVVVIMSGCEVQKSMNSNSSDSQMIDDTSRQGDTTVEGVVSKAGDKFFITDSNGKMQEVDTYSHDLATFEGKTVTITGQFSGDTLFAGEIQEVKE